MDRSREKVQVLEAELVAMADEVIRFRNEAAEIRLELRKFYGVDESISSADIVRKMLETIAALRR